MEKASQTESESSQVQDAELISETDNSKRLGLRIVMIAVVLLLLLHAAGFALWWQQSQQMQQLQTQLVPLQQLSQQQDALQSTLTEQQQASLAREHQLAELREQLSALAAEQSLTNAEIRLHWALAEIEYLLNMANQRLLLHQDVRGARVALDLVDKILEQTPDYRLHPLRALIADEELAMAALPAVDIAGIAVELQSAIDGVDKLRVVSGPQLDSAPAQLIDPQMQRSGNWQQALSDIWQQLRSLVVIRQYQDGSAAVLIPEQRYFLYQNLQLQLQTARFALLSGQAQVFSDSLRTAKQWLQQYFVGNERDAMLELLTELEGEYQQVVIPDISASLRWVQGFKP